MAGVFAILLLACVVRIPGIDFGLDRPDATESVLDHQNDELSMATAVQDGAGRDPGVFLHWGTLGLYLFRAGDRFLYETPNKSGSPHFRQAVLAERIHCHRLLSLGASLLTILLIYALARSVLGIQGAVLSAVLLALCYLHGREARFGTLDSFLAMYTAGVALASVQLLSRPGIRTAAGGFALVGFAAAIKYSGALLGALPVLAILLSQVAPMSARPRNRRALRGFLMAPLAGVAWLAATPHVFEGWEEMRAMLSDQSEVVGMKLPALPGVLKYHLTETFGVGLGWPLGIVAVVGLVVLLVRTSSRPWALIMFASFAILLTTRTTAVRYGEPLVGFAVIFAAAAILPLSKRCARLVRLRRATTSAMVCGVLIAILISIPSVRRMVGFVQVIRAEDTRVEALRYLNARTPDPSDVLQFATYGTTPYPDCWDFLRMVYRNRTWAMDEALALRPRFLVAEISDPEIQEWGIDAFLSNAGSGYRLVWSVESRARFPDVMALPDHTAGTPNFMVPWASPWHMTRPGPAIQIWERVSSGG